MVNPPDFRSRLLNHIWKLKLTPKIKKFVWKLIRFTSEILEFVLIVTIPSVRVSVKILIIFL